MATFHFDLVSPEKLLFSGEVNQVDVPGSDGDFGVLAGHAPLVTTLRPGILVIHGQAGAQRIVVHGGFAEVGANGLTVLADVAVPEEEFDRAVLAGEIKDTEDFVKNYPFAPYQFQLIQKIFEAVRKEHCGCHAVDAETGVRAAVAVHARNQERRVISVETGHQDLSVGLKSERARSGASGSDARSHSQPR